jgi:Flp pilus assembly protein TadG
MLARDRRGAIAVIFGLMAPVMMIALGLVVDTGFWVVASTRLQIAADAAAMSSAMTMSSQVFQQQPPSTQRSILQSLALFEAQAAANKLVGSLSTSPTIQYDGLGYTTISVTLTTQAPSLFSAFANVTAPVLSATSRAYVQPKPSCVLALAGSGTGITVSGSGTVIATGCGVFSDSTSTASISLNTGTITGASIGAAGTVSISGGTNSVTPAVPTANAPPVQDPNAGMTAPSPGSCGSTNTYTGFLIVILTPQTWCGNVTFGNGVLVTFLPGVYTVANGNLTFNDVVLSISAGVTFVLTGSSPGNFVWNNGLVGATTLVAPLLGPTAGVAIWLACNGSGNQTVSFQGIGALVVAGSIYAPCASVSLGNTASVTAAVGQNFNLIASTVSVQGASVLAAANVSIGVGASSGPMLGP